MTLTDGMDMEDKSSLFVDVDNDFCFYFGYICTDSHSSVLVTIDGVVLETLTLYVSVCMYVCRP